MKTGLTADLKTLLIATLPLLGTVLVAVFIFKFGLGKISDIRSKVTVSKKNESVLNQKLNLLTSISDSALAYSTLTSNALPESNSALATISQIKKLAVQHSVSVSNIKTSTELSDKIGVKKMDISFDVTGPRPSVLSFVATIKSFTPIVTLEKVKSTETGGVMRGEVAVKTYWAELPKKLPSLTEKINDLTSAEINLLTDLQSLTQPEFVEIPPAEGNTGRTDPFGI